MKKNHKKWNEKGGNVKEEPEEERERIISVSGVFSRREQMYASTQRLPLCTELAPWWVLAAAVSILFPWTPDALTRATAALCATPPGLKASWDAGPSPWPFNANPWALSSPGTLPGAVDSDETAGCSQGINDTGWWMWRETMLKSGRPPVSDGRGPGQKLWQKENRKQRALLSLALHYVGKDFTEVNTCD